MNSEEQIEVLKMIWLIRENIMAIDSDWSKTGGQVTPDSYIAATELTEYVRRLRELFDKIIV